VGRKIAAALTTFPRPGFVSIHNAIGKPTVDVLLQLFILSHIGIRIPLFPIKSFIDHTIFAHIWR